MSRLLIVLDPDPDLISDLIPPTSPRDWSWPLLALSLGLLAGFLLVVHL